MNTLLERDRDQAQDTAGSSRDPEISLGTGTILGIFFALAVLCAVFFGFGYALGVKRPAPVPILASTPLPAPNFSGFKPPSGSPLTPPPKPVETVIVPDTSAAITAAPESAPAANPAPTTHTAVTPRPTPPDAPPAVLTGPSAIVQVAAVSHQEDADLIASTLKRRGYAVLIRHEPQDALLHIQLGPFPTKKDAEAMRQRLQADGFNAYIK